MLPVGPLREPAHRLDQVDWRVVNGQAAGEGEYSMTLKQGDAINLKTGQRRPLAGFVGSNLHAAAGIGNPERFFSQLEQAGLTFTRHPLQDHQALQGGELDFDQAEAVLMTEKDGVKYRPFADQRHWVVPVEALLDSRLAEEIVGRIRDQ
jgi:tetraacyldisaccharide 4'-kinase